MPAPPRRTAYATGGSAARAARLRRRSRAEPWRVTCPKPCAVHTPGTTTPFASGCSARRRPATPCSSWARGIPTFPASRARCSSHCRSGRPRHEARCRTGFSSLGGRLRPPSEALAARARRSGDRRSRAAPSPSTPSPSPPASPGRRLGLAPLARRPRNGLRERCRPLLQRDHARRAHGELLDPPEPRDEARRPGRSAEAPRLERPGHRVEQDGAIRRVLGELADDLDELVVGRGVRLAGVRRVRRLVVARLGASRLGRGRGGAPAPTTPPPPAPGPPPPPVRPDPGPPWPA